MVLEGGGVGSDMQVTGYSDRWGREVVCEEQRADKVICGGGEG